VRVDDGYEEGMEIPIYYDPMIAKLITHGKDRAEVIERMTRAIDEYKISGMKTTLPFGKFMMQHPEFQKGNMSTRFIEEHFSPEKLSKHSEDEAVIAALIATEILSEKPQTPNSKLQTPVSSWKQNRLNLEL